MKFAVEENLEKVLERGEKLEELEAKSEELEATAQFFSRRARSSSSSKLLNSLCVCKVCQCCGRGYQYTKVANCG